MNDSKNDLKEKNEITIKIEIEKKDVKKIIYFLDNTDYIDENNNRKHYHDNLPELNISNTELFINGEKFDFQKYFIPKKQGIYIIKLRININIKNCSYMFNRY